MRYKQKCICDTSHLQWLVLTCEPQFNNAAGTSPRGDNSLKTGRQNSSRGQQINKCWTEFWVFISIVLEHLHQAQHSITFLNYFLNQYHFHYKSSDPVQYNMHLNQLKFFMQIYFSGMGCNPPGNRNSAHFNNDFIKTITNSNPSHQ